MEILIVSELAFGIDPLFFYINYLIWFLLMRLSLAPSGNSLYAWRTINIVFDQVEINVGCEF